MNSRERFVLALNHQEGDRVPIDIGCDMHNGISETAYVNLLKYLNEQDSIEIYDPIQHLAKVKESVLERLHTDTRYIFANSNYVRKIDENGLWSDEWGVVRKNAGLYDDAVLAPLANCSYEDIKKYKMPNPLDATRFAGLKKKAQALYDNTEYALIGGNAISLFYLSSEIIGYQEYMEKILLETKSVELLIDRLMEWQMEFFRKYLECIGSYIEMIWFGDDWGTQIAPLMNPNVFREIFIKRYTEMIRQLKKYANVKVALHSCGAIKWALDDFAKAGFDVIHPLQGDAMGLDEPHELKRRYGNDLVFYSNLKNQTVIPYGTPQEVENDVKDKIHALAKNGGFIISGGHNFQADVPPENILALVDAALKYGEYKTFQKNK